MATSGFFQLITKIMAKWTGTLTGITAKGKRVLLTATVEAPSSYAASDKIKAMAEKAFGDIYFPVILFGNKKSKLSPNSVSAKVSKKSGPEEDA